MKRNLRSDENAPSTPEKARHYRIAALVTVENGLVALALTRFASLALVPTGT